MATTLTDDLRRIVFKPTRGKGTLSSTKTRESIPKSKGSAAEAGEDKAASTSSSEGGIASPLIEQEDMREYHTEQAITSSDGIFVIVYAPIKKAYFKDSNRLEVVVEYTDEVRPPPEEA